MIISHSHQFIFYAIPKTASQALRLSLRPHLSGNDWEQCILNDIKSFPVKSLADIKHGHLSYREISPFLLQEMKDNYFSFCVVRDPVDRLLSFAHFHPKYKDQMAKHPMESLENILDDPQRMRHILLWPQSEFVVDITGNLVVDYIGRYENIDEIPKHLSEHLGLEISPLQYVNASKRTITCNDIDITVKNKIYRAYREDYRNFNYSL